MVDKATGEIIEKAWPKSSYRKPQPHAARNLLWGMLIAINVVVWSQVYMLGQPTPTPIAAEHCFEGWRKDEGWTQFCVEEGEEAACPKGYFCPTLQKGVE